MTKSELKTGMIITNRNGDKFMVFRKASVRDESERDFLVEIYGRVFSELYNYDESMMSYVDTQFDIMRVEQCDAVRDLLNPKRETTLLWKRKEKKRYTYAQLREILGEEFEVVG